MQGIRRTSNTPPYFPTLDGWRAVAIILVFLQHGAASIADATGLRHIVQMGDSRCGVLGVHVFFGISGFLITSLLVDEERRCGAITLSSFYVRRFFRIVPAAFVMLLFVAALAFFGVLDDVYPVEWIGALLFFMNYLPAPTWSVGHFWSLSVEEHFYLLWPTIFLVLSSFRRRLTAVIPLALVLSVWAVLDARYSITGPFNWNSETHTDVQANGLLWGAAAALMYADKEWRQSLNRIATPWTAWLIIAFLVVTYAGLTGFGRATLPLEAVLIPLMLVATVLHPRTFIGRFLESPPLRYIGKLSYSIYLWQQLFVWTYHPALGVFEIFPLNLVCALICAAASYYLIETPIRNWGRRFAPSRNYPTTPRLAGRSASPGS